MTTGDFKIFWASTFPDTIPIAHNFKHDYKDRWFRIHSLPESKRYADNEQEWNILVDRQNEIITDFLNDNSDFILVTGNYSIEGYTELQSSEEIDSMKYFSFISIGQIDLNKLSPDEYDVGQFYTPMFSDQIWQPHKFDDVLKDIASDRLRAFFISFDKNVLIAPYDGGIDFILKDNGTRNIYRKKYSAWLSERQDGL